MGTSLTFGYGSGCKVLPPRADCQADSAYPALLQQRLRLPVVNLGLPMASSATGRRQLERALAHHPALVLLEFGANDLFDGLPAEAARANLVNIIEPLQGRGVRVGLLSFVHPDMIARTPAGHRLEEQAVEGLAYYAMLTGLAAEYRLPIVDYLLEGIWWEPELMHDQIHPNGRGYLRMEENIFRGFQGIFAASGMLR
jgi:acyl-CoA thioesterase-1